MQQSIAAAVVVMGYAAVQCDEQLTYVIDHRRRVSSMRGSVVTPFHVACSSGIQIVLSQTKPQSPQLRITYCGLIQCRLPYAVCQVNQLL